MKGEVLIPFIAQLENGRKFRGIAGNIIDLPPNVDWVQAGFVRVVEDEKPPAKPKAKKVSDGG